MTRINQFLLALVVVFAAGRQSLADTPAPTPARLEISVTQRGFEPNKLTVKKGVPVTLVFTRKTDQTCAKAVVVHVTETDKVERPLPLNQPVEVAVTFPKSGTLEYACGMDMVKGVLTVQ